VQDNVYNLLRFPVILTQLVLRVKHILRIYGLPLDGHVEETSVESKNVAVFSLWYTTKANSVNHSRCKALDCEQSGKLSY
jgi:hypothetical protein